MSKQIGWSTQEKLLADIKDKKTYSGSGGSGGSGGGDASAANQLIGNTSLSSIVTNTSRIPSLGQASMAASLPVVLSSDQLPISTVEISLSIIGAATQTAVVNNILPTSAGAAATDVTNYRSMTVQIISTGTGGTFIFEQSNDNVNFRPLPVFNAELVTGVPITAAITATSSQIVYTIPLRCRFIRLRIATTITGGSIQAFSKISTEPWTASVQLVASNVAANLAVTANIGTGSLGAGTNLIGYTGSPTPTTVADVSSAALTSTTTTAAFTPAFGSVYQVNIPVTSVTGTTPVLDFSIEESDDSGTNWFKVYDFPRITATGIYRSPKLPLTGNRVRYVQTLAGTTPSFTRAVNRLQSNESISPTRQLIDRTITLTTLSSTTPSINVQNCRSLQLNINIGTFTTAPALQLQASDDNGVSWTNIGTPLIAVASSTVTSVIVTVQAQLVRAIVTTAGVGVTAGYVLVKGF
jgi:hypothetical protein